MSTGTTNTFFGLDTRATHPGSFVAPPLPIVYKELTHGLKLGDIILIIMTVGILLSLFKTSENTEEIITKH